MNPLNSHLDSFKNEHGVTTKGFLSLVVQLTRNVQNSAFPLNQNDFITGKKGQVSGIGGGNLKKILADYGITQTLSQEGGRTSRGNMDLKEKYVDFLNELYHKDLLDLQAIEKYWIEQVRQYFNNKPFILASDPSRTIISNLNDLFEQVRKRQKENPGSQYLGAMLQHLVAAKLSIIMPEKIDIHGASVADSPTGRSGDFVLDDTILHCTTAPGEPLIKKCSENIQAGCNPIIITIFERVKTALDLATDAGLSGRIEVWDVQQFISANVHEHSFFSGKNRNASLAGIIEKYNEIILEQENDPSLQIKLQAK